MTSVAQRLFFGDWMPAVPALPPCDYCKEEEADHPEWPSDPASVRYDGKWACGWHGVFMWGSEPASAFLAMGLDCV